MNLSRAIRCDHCQEAKAKQEIPHERHTTGRKQASPDLVVRSSVRIFVTIATHNSHFTGSDLAPRDLAQWRTLRKQVTYRHEARREQYRFRKNPERYLLALEEQFSQKKMWF
jgi:hypothetical protein